VASQVGRKRTGAGVSGSGSGADAFQGARQRRALAFEQELALEESPVQLAVGQHPLDRLGHT
jgi:hypothetical protein